MMEIPIRLNVTGQWIKTGGIVLVSSSVNIYSCSFVFSDDWNGYIKTAVFCLNDGTNFEVPILQDTCNIPWEALQEPGNLRIGVYGIMGSCENGQRYPTVWTNDIRVARGTPSGETNPPTPSAYEQFVQQVEVHRTYRQAHQLHVLLRLLWLAASHKGTNTSNQKAECM